MQQRHCTIKRDEDYTHGYPFQQLNSAKTTYVEVRIPERLDGETPAMSVCTAEKVAEEQDRYDIFEQVKNFMFERIGGQSTVKQKVKPGEGRDWVLASWNFSLGNMFRLVGTVARTETGILKDEGGVAAKTKGKGKRDAPIPVNLAGKAAPDRVKRKRQVSPAVGSAAASDATHTQEDEPDEEVLSWEGDDMGEQLEELAVPAQEDEQSEEEEEAPRPKKRRTRKERFNNAAKEQADALVVLKNLLTEQSLQDARARPAPQTLEEKRDLQDIENVHQLMAQELAALKMQNELLYKGLEEAKAAAELARAEGK
ncbi:hypothetical protein CYMTET_51151 [Cymbomonas tetramitiformis]|uniref:Uncharacterized protein n=1 Tax=Cymbomonas tetramitiformis TaxID=36881 RepID=A0AAE0BMT9_9CHLO|nr:hypothetical protein CYMTET_51151 [Cymbomonas tetramitiformis]